MMQIYFFNQLTNKLTEYMLGPRGTKSHDIPSFRGHLARGGRQIIQCDKFFDAYQSIGCLGIPEEEHHTQTKTNFNL